MCTRYFIEKDAPELKKIIEAVSVSSLAARFRDHYGRPVRTSGEIRPMDIVPVIAPDKNGRMSVFPMRWGFSGPVHKTTLFNARVETAAIKPTFQESWRSYRCIIPASWYFEWQHYKSTDGRTKTGDKYAIQPKDVTSIWLCGLYRIENGYPVFVILTKEPADSLQDIHDRMPFLLPEEKIEDWIDPASDPASMLPYAMKDMVMEKVLPDDQQMTLCF
ncbi:MAG: SOS response-associated peptidase [Lachnospiraceae bacterium]|nr:SOS response-associated peptidase [Lachnospiraceae bacterium]